MSLGRQFLSRPCFSTTSIHKVHRLGAATNKHPDHNQRALLAQFGDIGTFHSSVMVPFLNALNKKCTKRILLLCDSIGEMVLVITTYLYMIDLSEVIPVRVNIVTGFDSNFEIVQGRGTNIDHQLT